VAQTQSRPACPAVPVEQAERWGISPQCTIHIIAFGTQESSDWNKSAVCNARLQSVVLYRSQFGLRREERFGRACVLA
jgi:hypothetical protein